METNTTQTKGETMETIDQAVAKTIADQMGGTRRISIMTGAKHFVNHGNALSFKFPNRQRSKGNYVKVTLRPDDTYDMEFQNVPSTKAMMNGKDSKVVKVFEGVYNDMLIELFENQTGLYFSI